ncbi:hypothetical protein GCM10010466_34060 [Planomonospora alba]|uniref:Uncharacterized protein n=1 Tax=Planomonospora alba TaxID=161354 RepID=A0ABP6N8R4_9ACTN
MLISVAAGPGPGRDDRRPHPAAGAVGIGQLHRPGGHDEDLQGRVRVRLGGADVAGEGEPARLQHGRPLPPGRGRGRGRRTGVPTHAPSSAGRFRHVTYRYRP